MLPRIGNVVYWTSTIIAVLMVLMGVSIVSMVDEQPGKIAFVLLVIAIQAATIWLAGLGIRYVLSGKLKTALSDFTLGQSRHNS